jgi:Na+/melibiose symporter-like transporter
MLLIALAVWRLGTTRADLTVVIVLASMFLFFVVDALVSVPWFDLLARALPPLRRGRILGLAQVLGGLGGIGAGVFVRYALGDASPWRFPDNYALLYVLAFVGITGSSVALSLIREPRSAALETREVAGFGAIMASLPRILVNDRPFLRLIIVRVVSGFVTMASAFYIVFATQELGLALASTGLFVSAQVAGSLTSGLVMGALQDRWGPRIHMRVMMLISMMSPLLALLMKPLAATLGTAVLYPYLLVFFFMGIYMSNTGWPYFNWIL